MFLNSWSSTGKDMALLGIPTVIYSDEILLYPTELNYFGDTLESYFSAIERALRDGWSAEKVRRSYRWAAYEFSRSTIDIGDSFHEIEMPKRSLLEKVGGRLRGQLDKDYRQRGDLQRFSLPRSADQIVDVVESRRAPLSTACSRKPVSHLKRKRGRCAPKCDDWQKRCFPRCLNGRAAGYSPDLPLRKYSTDVSQSILHQ